MTYLYRSRNKDLLNKTLQTLIITGASLLSVAQTASAEDVQGWLEWRGPLQNGVSQETGITNDLDPKGKSLLWSLDIKGRGTVVTAGANAYVWGYRGEKSELSEVLACVEIDSGKVVWELKFRDFISDIIYDRYSIGAPSVDAETGNIYLMTSPGLFVCVSPQGKILWEVSMMEEFGRLTFPNGRTGAPAIDGELVIVNAITSNWGKQGPAATRFYAFNKKSGQLVWTSKPGLRPKDSSFCTPYFEWRNGQRVFYAGTGCGHIVCVNALTGQPIWRYDISAGGVNSSVVVHKDRLIAIHGKQNLDTSNIGRMVAIKLGTTVPHTAKEPVTLDKSAELWRNNDLAMFTASPTIVGDTVYQVTAKGVLFAVDVMTGKAHWQMKLGNEQLHASPLFVDGKLYIAIRSGEVFVVKPTKEKGELLGKFQLEGSGIGSPSVWRGRVFVHTTKKLYCFGPKKAAAMPAAIKEQAAPKAGEAVKLQAIPVEVLLQPGKKQSVNLRLIDKNGLVVGAYQPKGPFSKLWQKFIPPTAKVKAYLDASFDDSGAIGASAEAKPSAGAYKFTEEKLSGVIRGRVLAKLPIKEDFSNYELKVPHKTDGVNFAYPPLPWIGARFKWEVRERDGEKVLAKTLDRVLFQRSTTFIGPASLKNYTIQADVLSDGSRRGQSSIGLVNQRYIVFLDGNWQRLEVFSNQERFKVNVPFKWKRKTWYTLKVRVDIDEKGTGTIRAKAWKRGEKEPEKWTLEATHESAHTNGAPGFFAFSPQGRYRVYLDNVQVTQN